MRRRPPRAPGGPEQAGASHPFLMCVEKKHGGGFPLKGRFTFDTPRQHATGRCVQRASRLGRYGSCYGPPPAGSQADRCADGPPAARTAAVSVSVSAGDGATLGDRSAPGRGRPSAPHSPPSGSAREGGRRASRRRQSFVFPLATAGSVSGQPLASGGPPARATWGAWLEVPRYCHGTAHPSAVPLGSAPRSPPCSTAQVVAARAVRRSFFR